MKKLMILASLVIVASLTFSIDAKKKKEGTASLQLSETVFDFGTIKEDGGPVSHDFQFTNTGDGTLVIYDATAECGCTRPQYPKNPIASGKKSKIKVTYAPLGRPGPFSKAVTIKTNGNPHKIQLKIKGVVTPKKQAK